MLTVGGSHLSEVQQLTHGLVFQRKRGGKKDSSLCGLVVNVIDAIAITQRDALASECPLKSLILTHGCCRSTSGVVLDACKKRRRKGAPAYSAQSWRGRE